MNDHDALLHAIGEHPEEDTPRLMYADWLEENGEPERADFVRVQVELARPGLSGAERMPLVRKHVHYLTNFVREWKTQLPQLDGIEWGDFNRGLIEEVQAAAMASIVDHAKQVFAVPGIHVLRLRMLGNARVLARVPELTRLRALKLVGARANPDPLRELLASPYLGRLTGLALDENRADNAVAADIADGRFPNLEHLWLGGNRIGTAGAIALANSQHLTKLRLLDVRDNLLTDHAALTALRRRFGSALKV